MARPNIKKIRGAAHPLGTGDFTTIQAWEDWADGLTDPYQWAECYQGVDLGTFTLAGWSSTPTSSGYPRVYASSGELHDGSLNKGPIIAPVGSTALNTIGINYARVDGLGSTRGFEMNISTGSNMIIENCWATSEDSTCFKALASVGTGSSSGNIFRNCLAIGTAGNDIGFEIGGENMMGGEPEIKCLNNTVYGHKNTGVKVYNTYLPGFLGGADVTVKNCIAMDCGSDFSYQVGGSGTLINENNLSSDTTASTYGFYNVVSKTASGVFVNPDTRISVTTLGIAGSGVSVAASGDFRLKRNSPAIDFGLDLADVPRDIKGLKRPYDGNLDTYAATDIGAYEYGLFTSKPASGVTLFIAGPLGYSSGIPLMMAAHTTQVTGSGTLFIDGTSKTSSFISLYTTAKIPSSGSSLLNIGNFTFKRTSPLFIKTESISEAEGIGGLGTLFGGLEITGGAGGGGSAEQFAIAKPSGTISFRTLFLQAAKQPASGQVPLNTQGFSGVTGPESLAYYRSPDVISDGYFPKRRTAFLFAGSETNCVDGSFYNFQNNTRDVSDDYNFTLYPSGFYGGGSGDAAAIGLSTPFLESGFYQTSTRFPAASLAGSGAIRFVGGTTAGVKIISDSTYYGTVLMQSGSPSIHDQHRFTPPSGFLDPSGNFTPPRRGVAAAFWINKKKGRKTIGGLTPIQGVMGNLELFAQTRFAASGEWGIYYTPTAASASGSTPFNSLKSLLKVNDAGHVKVDTAADTLGGIMPFVNTTGGGSMGKILKVNESREIIDATVPDTMIPLEEDRWYYMQFWWDTQLKESYARIASPAKGTPGQSGYMPEIKPITDKCQKWYGYDVKTETNDLKFKIGGNLFRNQGAVPYYNLGYNSAATLSSQEKFLLDEVTISNEVCSVTAMEQQFDSKYEYYTKQFLETQQATLFISGIDNIETTFTRIFG